GRRFLDQIVDSVHAVAKRRGIDHAITRDFRFRDALDEQQRTFDFIEHREHLRQRRRIRVNHVVGQDDGERLVAVERTRYEHRVSEPERLALTDVGDVDQIGDLSDFLELVALAARLEECLELDGDVEVIFDRILAAAGDEDDVVDAGSDGFLDAVLNDWFVYERQHFFRLRLGGGKEARAQSGSGEHGFAHQSFHDLASYHWVRCSTRRTSGITLIWW